MGGGISGRPRAVGKAGGGAAPGNGGGVAARAPLSQGTSLQSAASYNLQKSPATPRESQEMSSGRVASMLPRHLCASKTQPYGQPYKSAGRGQYWTWAEEERLKALVHERGRVRPMCMCVYVVLCLPACQPA